MVAHRQTPEDTASSTRHKPTEISGGKASPIRKPASRDNDGFDLARFSPQQIAGELARRSQSLRATVDLGAQDDHAAAAPSTAEAGGNKAPDPSAPFDRLSQALSPSIEERQRLKQQYVDERYRWEEEQDRREALKLRDGESEDEHADRAMAASPDFNIRPDFNQALTFTAGSRFAADSRWASRAAEVENSREQASPAKPADPVSVYRDTVADPGADLQQRSEALRIDRDMLGHATRDQGVREPRLTVMNAEEVRSVLRAPDDVRGLITTSFERPGKASRAPSAESQTSDQPTSYPPRSHRHGYGRGPEYAHRHGALLLLVALAIGATLYFHPWTRGEEGAVRPDLSLNTTAGKTTAGKTSVSGSAAGPSASNAPVNSPAPNSPAPNSPATISSPAGGKAETMPAQLPQPAATSPATAAARPAGPAPAVEMTPLSAQSAAPQPAQPRTPSANVPAANSQVQGGDTQAAAASTGVAGEGAAAGKAQPDSATSAAATPQLAPQAVQPKQSYAPADMVTQPQQAPQPARSILTTQPGATQPGATQPGATQPAKSAGSKLQSQTTRSGRDIKPSPAWLHVQPYDGGTAGGGTADGGAAAPLTGADTPDAWMKPQPYRAPGVLTPPN